jgi:hypothetical protein
MGINWGTPVLRQRKEERFSTPVVTMSALAGKGSGRKFSFNKSAQEALGLKKLDEDNGEVSYVTFGKGDGNSIFVMASDTEKPEMRMFKTNKSFSFSDKKTYEFITRTLGLSNASENHLKLEAVENEAYFQVIEVVSDAPTAEGAEEDSNTEEAAAPTEEANDAGSGASEEVAQTPGEEVKEEASADAGGDWD